MKPETIREALEEIRQLARLHARHGRSPSEMNDLADRVDDALELVAEEKTR